MKKSPSITVTYVLVFLSMLFWGLTFVWTSIVFDYYNPITTIFLRLLISTVLMFAGLKIFGYLEKINKSDYLLFMVSALFNPFLYFLGENYGVKYSSPTISAVVIAVIPVFTPILGYFALRERLTAINIIGMIVSFLGVLLILLKNDFSLSVQPLGVIALSVAVITAIIYSLLLKKLAGKYSAFFIIAVQNLIGLIYFLPLFLVFEWNEFILVKPNFKLIASLVQLAVFGSSLAFVFYTIGNRELGVSKTNFFTNLIPVITAVFSFFVLGEVFNMQKIVGIMVVILGVILSQLQGKSKLVSIYRFFVRNRK